MDTLELSDASLLSGINNHELKDALSAYLDAIKIYPGLSDEETYSLFKTYQKTKDSDIRDWLINNNLRLAVWFVKNKMSYGKTYEFIDLIQEANIALINAVDTFDTEYGNKFSTYATRCMHNHLINELNRNDSVIRIPVHKSELINKYKKYVAAYEQEKGKSPSEAEILAYLEISKEEYMTLLKYESEMSNIDSLNRPITETEETSVEDLVASEDFSYIDLEKAIDDKLLCLRLKKVLSPYQYYVLYNSVLVPEKKSLEKVFLISRQAVSSILKSVYNKIVNLGILNKTCDIKNNNLTDIMPIDFKKKAILLFLRNQIPIDDYMYLYYLWYEKIDDNSYIRKLKMSESEFDAHKQYMNQKYANIFNMNDQKYAIILNKLKSKYTIAGIFDADLKEDINSYNKANTLLNNVTKEEFIMLLGDDYEGLNSHQKVLIDDYFDCEFAYISKARISQIEAKINTCRLNYCHENHLPLDILYDVYIHNKNMFDLDYRKYVEGTLFSELTGKSVPFSYTYSQRKEDTIIRLSQIYYGIKDYFSYKIPKKEIARIIDEYGYLFENSELDILNKHYLNSEVSLSMVELLDEVDLDTLNDVIKKSRLAYYRVVSLYLGLYKNFVIKDEGMYVKYIMDPTFSMVPLNRKVCELRFVKHLDYQTIANTLGIDSTQKVSNIIKKSERLIDMHYYNISGENHFEDDKIMDLLNSMSLSANEFGAIKSRFTDKKSPDEIKEEFNLNVNKYNELIRNFTYNYFEYYRVKNISIKDIQDEINKHPTDSVISDLVKRVLAYRHGIKCSFNELGVKMSKKDIVALLDISEEVYFFSIRRASYLIGAKKAGIITYPSTLGRLSRREVEEALNDPHIPLKETEKKLLQDIKGIGTSTKTLEELALDARVNEASIRRRVETAFLSILKYRAGKKHPRIDYDIDVLPNLKYFPLYDQKILKAYYRDNLDLAYFEKNYNFSHDYASKYIEKLTRRLTYLLKYKHAALFDFDYARSVINAPDLPYDGDLASDREIFIRYFGNDGTLPETHRQIISRLGKKDLDTSLIIRKIMIAVLMYKDGYRKNNVIPIEEIKDFYHSHKDDYNKDIQSIFESSIKMNNPNRVNDLVIYEILKEQDADLLSLCDLEYEEAKSIIRDNPYHNSERQLETIRQLFKISKRDFMSGKNKHKMYKLASQVLNKTMTSQNVKKRA